MEPRIQYATTEDGVSIAYWALGEGRVPLIMSSPLGLSHISLEHRLPDLGAWYERLAATRLVVRYDERNSGLSQRNIQELSDADYARDVEAVLEHLGFDQADLWALRGNAPPILRFAAEHSDVVRRLVLWDPYVRGHDELGQPRKRTIIGLIKNDWELFTETFAGDALGWSGDEAHEYARFIRRSVTQEDAARVFAAFSEMDATQWLEQISAPTLVVHTGTWPEGAQQMAAGIPNARLVELGRRDLPFRSETGMRATEEFLDEGEEEEPAAPAAPGGLVTILFTDMQSSTALTERLGDAGAQEVRRAHNQIVRTALDANGGSEVKHTGDGIMASFGSAIGALNCAIAIQRGVQQHQDEHVKRHAEPVEASLHVYIGLNAGEPIAEEQDLFGTSVDLAARICAEAEPSEILVSDVVRQLAAGKQFLFSDRGESALRGFEDPVRLWSVRWREDG